MQCMSRAIQVQGTAAESTEKGLTAGTLQPCASLCVGHCKKLDQLLACPSAWVKFLFVFFGYFLLALLNISQMCKVGRKRDRMCFKEEHRVKEELVAWQNFFLVWSAWLHQKISSVGDPQQLQVMGAQAVRCHIPAGTLSLSGDL